MENARPAMSGLAMSGLECREVLGATPKAAVPCPAAGHLPCGMMPHDAIGGLAAPAPEGRRSRPSHTRRRSRSSSRSRSRSRSARRRTRRRRSRTRSRSRWRKDMKDKRKHYKELHLEALSTLYHLKCALKCNDDILDQVKQLASEMTKVINTRRSETSRNIE